MAFSSVWRGEPCSTEGKFAPKAIKIIGFPHFPEKKGVTYRLAEYIGLVLNIGSYNTQRRIQRWDWFKQI
jgi:hypothetical protein